MPLRYRDDLPVNPNPPIISLSVTEPEEFEDEVAGPSALPSTKSDSESGSEFGSLFCTERNAFGVYRKYSFGPPTITPDDSFTLSSISDSISIAHDPADSHSKTSWTSSFGLSHLAQTTVENLTDNYFAPFLNPSTFLLMSWYYNGSSIKSYADVDKLIHEVICHKDFLASDFGETFSTAREAERMDKHRASKISDTGSSTTNDLPFNPEDGWISGTVSIPLPCDGFRFNSEDEAPQFVVNNVWYRRPLEVIKRAFTEPAADRFHTLPRSRNIGSRLMKNPRNVSTQKHLPPMFSTKNMRHSERHPGKVQTATWRRSSLALYFIRTRHILLVLVLHLYGRYTCISGINRNTFAESLRNSLLIISLTFLR